MDLMIEVSGVMKCECFLKKDRRIVRWLNEISADFIYRTEMGV